MRNLFRRLKGFGKKDPTNQAEQEFMKTCAGRMVSVMTFIVILGYLGVWITFFLVVKDRLSAQTLSGNVISNLTCIVFFWRPCIGAFCGCDDREFHAAGLLEMVG